MNAQQLRNSIFQLAIQGKLVPQDPNDEPASVLLERIRQQKEQLVKLKQITSKELICVPVGEDEKEFEIPASWEWCRIEDLFLHSSGKQQSSNNKSGTPHQFITTSNLYWNRFVLDKVKVMNFTEKELLTCSAQKGDLLVCEGGAGYGRSAIWTYDYDICLQNHIHRLRPLVSGTCEYVYYIIYLLKESNCLTAVGTAMPGLSANRLKNIVIPLPPLAEQRRIVAKLEELLPLVEQYGKAQDDLNALNADLPRRLRQSILQEAIQGKLVPQDPNDEPASVLLERIRKEKEQLVKEGKLKKKDLSTTPIAEEDIPFDIPDGWEWAKVGNIFQTYSGGTPEKGHPEYYSSKDVRWAKVGDLGSLYLSDTEEYISNAGFANSSAKLYPEQTILVAMYCNDAIGKSSVTQSVMASNQAICGLLPNKNILPEYVYYAIQYFRPSLIEKSAGGAQKNINQKIVNDIIFPLPPLAEQHRIVAKIEQLFTEIDKLV